MLPSLTSLRAFEAAARAMSFAKAADELGVSAAAISHRIKNLEDFFGVGLFKRMNRKVELTENGRLLYPDVHEAFEMLIRGVGRVRPKGIETVLTVGVGPAFSAKWLAPRVWRFMETHPAIQVHIAAFLGVSSLGPGGVDVSIRFGTEVPPETYAEVLLHETLVPLCAPTLREALDLSRPEDVLRASLIHDDSTKSVPDWGEWMRVAGVEGDTTRGLRFNHADHAIDAAIEGAGIVLGRRTLALKDMRAGRLVQPFEPALPIDPCFRFICPKGRETTPAIAAFLGWMREEADAFARLDEAPAPLLIDVAG